MYPAIEIDLHLDRICAAQRQCPAALEAALRALTYGTNLLPIDTSRGREPAAGEVIAGTAEESIGDAGEADLPQPEVAELADDDHRRPARSAGPRPQQITDFAPSRRQIHIRDLMERGEEHGRVPGVVVQCPG
jgi:hypothetical protein